MFLNSAAQMMARHLCIGAGLIVVSPTTCHVGVMLDIDSSGSDEEASSP